MTEKVRSKMKGSYQRPLVILCAAALCFASAAPVFAAGDEPQIVSSQIEEGMLSDEKTAGEEKEPFPRDLQFHWAGTAVNSLMEAGIIENEDGRFKPDRPATRGEAADLLAAFLRYSRPQQLSQGAVSVTFTDVTLGSKSAGSIGTLAENHIFSGYPDGTFHPEETLSREAFASMIYQTQFFLEQTAGESAPSTEAGITGPEMPDGKSADPAAGAAATKPAVTGSGIAGTGPAATGSAITGSAVTGSAVTGPGMTGPTASNGGTGQPDTTGGSTEEAVFPDIRASYAAEAIRSLAEQNIFHGYPDGTFRPQDSVTRGEASAVLFALSGLASVPPKVDLPDVNVIEVPYISQIEPYEAWVGCEATSLLMGLKGKGYAAATTLPEFLDGMPKTESDPAKGFVGSPYKPDKEKKTRTTIYPPVLAEYASRFGKVSDFSGSSVEELQAELLAGNPVVAYVTLFWEKPNYRIYDIEGAQQRLLSNNHAVLVCGYDRSTMRYYISDPYNVEDRKSEYKYWIPASIFDPLYNERKHALVVE